MHYRPCPNCRHSRFDGELCLNCGYQTPPPKKDSDPPSCPRCASHTFDGVRCDYCGYDVDVLLQTKEPHPPLEAPSLSDEAKETLHRIRPGRLIDPRRRPSEPDNIKNPGIE